MSKVLVDRELLERVAALLEWDGMDDTTPLEFGAKCDSLCKELSDYITQPAEVDALMKWKQTAEYWYGQYRFVKHGESPAEYPTEGKLDDWHNSYHNP